MGSRDHTLSMLLLGGTRMDIIFRRIKLIHNSVNRAPVLVVISALLVLYYCNCTYFKCVLLADRLTVAYLLIENDGTGMAVFQPWLIILLWLALVIIYLNVIAKAFDTQQQMKQTQMQNQAT